MRTPSIYLSIICYRAACEVDNTENSQRQFSDSLSSTLNALTQNMESLHSNLSEEEMMAALAGLNVGQPKTNEGRWFYFYSDKDNKWLLVIDPLPDS